MMTRTRTQAALTKLVQPVANIHGELELVRRLTDEYPIQLTVLEAHLHELEANCVAFYLTLRQFDSTLDPMDVKTSDTGV